MTGSSRKARTDKAASPAKPEAFEKFEDLARCLLAVPKEEADAEAKELKRRKSKKPR